ncbi:cas1p-like protein [Ophiostoma piceae UAMH 11346]|uniref:Cas1p-like protein n=1 Tax=Ophiostoma piceae (strain UAMH 11346) TaxID=1262450 RepID=S3C632_OPHP1|nr:cas1p-like protein [Ophiostoma piceae UAMH 11346]
MVRPAASVSSGNGLGTSGRRASRVSFLNTGNSFRNAILRLSVAIFCIGIALQALSGNSDPYRCGALVKHGSWPPYTSPSVDDAMDYEQLESLKKDGRELPPARPFEKWEPAGCRMHEYSREDIGYCLGGKRILFVGDSAARIIFFAALTRLDHESAEWLLRSTFVEDNPRHDLSIESESVVLDFLWDPWLNSSIFTAELSPSDPKRSELFQAAGEPEPPPKADLVIVGSSGLWAARNAGDDYFQSFKTATDLVAQSMQSTIRPFSGARDASSDDYIFLTPVTIPRYDMLPTDRAKALSPERIERINSYLASLSSTAQSHILTAYNEMTHHVPEAYEETGLHVSEAVAERWIDIPLNARCNGLLARLSEDRPESLAFKTTCCVAYPGLVSGQRFLFVGIFASMLPPILFFCFKRGAKPPSSIATAFVGLAVLLCYMADRSHLFAKAEKRYSTAWVYFSAFATGVVFIASRRQARLPKSNISQQHGFLPRHVSDEWKGLMQVAFLLLAYQDGLDKPVAINWSEFVLNSYLFLSAFGHTSYFLKTGDCSFRRVASTLFRLNILPCLLVFMLDGLASGLYFLNSTWDVEAMRNTVASAWCSPFFGMAIAVISHRVSFIRSRTTLAHSVPRQGQRSKHAASIEHGFINKGSSWIDRRLVNIMFPNEFTEPLYPMFVIFCGVFTFGFANMITLSPLADEGVYYPLSTSAAVLCLAVVRNCHEKLQSTFLFFPSVLGGIALELTVLHNHLLLSGNGTGRLRLFSTYTTPTEGNAIVGALFNAKVTLYQSVEVVSIVAVFITVSWHSHQAIRQIASMLFGSSVKATKASALHDIHEMHDKHATDDESVYSLPISDDGFHFETKNTKTWYGTWISDARLRAVYLLLLLWGWNRYYI